MKQALVVRGGWDGHQPVETTNLFIPFLEANGFTVRVEESPAIYADATFMATVDLIQQTMTMSTIEKEEFLGLRAAIENGTGFAGWHGGIADSYRNNSDYLHLVGGQFAWILGIVKLHLLQSGLVIGVRVKFLFAHQDTTSRLCKIPM